MIDLTGADQYFAGHHMGAVWTAYPPEVRTAAIASARMMLARALGRGLDDDEPAYAEGSTLLSDAYATYEQALHLMEHSRSVDSNAGQPYPVARPDAPPVQTRKNPEAFPRFSDDALRWLGWNGASVIRG